MNRQGQDLMRIAKNDISTTVLEADLKQLNMKWNDINQALKFQETMNSQSKWLGDTEKMIASEKPLSDNSKVNKEQIQAQKIIHKLLLDRQKFMTLLFQFGVEICLICEPIEK